MLILCEKDCHTGIQFADCELHLRWSFRHGDEIFALFISE